MARPTNVPLSKLVALAQRGLSLRAIGQEVGLTKQAVEQRLASAKLSVGVIPLPRSRVCAACGAVLPRGTRHPDTRFWCTRPECQREAARVRMARSRSKQQRVP